MMIGQVMTAKIGDPSVLFWIEEARANDPELRLKEWESARKQKDVTRDEFRLAVLGLSPMTDEQEDEIEDERPQQSAPPPRQPQPPPPAVVPPNDDEEGERATGKLLVRQVEHNEQLIQMLKHTIDTVKPDQPTYIQPPENRVIVEMPPMMLPEINVSQPEVKIENVLAKEPVNVQVVVPNEAIRVDVNQPDVTVNVPEQPPAEITVNSPALEPSFVVNVPEQPTPSVSVSVPAPNVNVQVPEQKPPTVTVNPPQVSVQVPEHDKPKRARIQHSDGSSSEIELE